MKNINISLKRKVNNAFLKMEILRNEEKSTKMCE